MPNQDHPNETRLKGALQASAGARYYDISPEVRSDSAVFPGDTAFRRRVLMDTKSGNDITLSAIETTVHVGAHTDAPNHYHREGRGIETRDLNHYLGDCQVVSVRIARGAGIMPTDLPVEWQSARQLPGRMIFHTGSFPDPYRWNADFNHVSPELVRFLADRGVRLIGIDTPSVDPSHYAVLETHQVIFERDLAILEGVVLDGVPDGHYTLVALPLRLKDADASPVRAILLESTPTKSSES